MRIESAIADSVLFADIAQLVPDPAAASGGAPSIDRFGHLLFRLFGRANAAGRTRARETRILGALLPGGDETADGRGHSSIWLTARPKKLERLIPSAVARASARSISRFGK